MAKFHITSRGEAAQCRASKKACPLGGEHFDSAEEAMLSTYAAELGNATAGRRELAPASAESRADADREQLRKQEQLKLILEKNPMQDDYHVGIRKLEDIKTLEDAYRHDVQEELNNAWTDQPDEIYEEAFRTGVITVYSSKTFQEGDFVSTSYNEAEQYAGPGGVNSKEVPLENVAWIDSSEGMYAPVDVSVEAPGTAESDQQEIAARWNDLPRIVNAPEGSLQGETPESVAKWTQANAHRIYEAMAKRGWDDDSASRESLFELTSKVLKVPYDDLYDAWLAGSA